MEAEDVDMAECWYGNLLKDVGVRIFVAVVV